MISDAPISEAAPSAILATAADDIESWIDGDGTASVAVLWMPYMGYLHIARFGDRWLIVNALWQRRAGR